MCQKNAEDINQSQSYRFLCANFPGQSVEGLNHLEFALLERELGRGSMALTHFGRLVLMACDGDQIERY